MKLRYDGKAKEIIKDYDKLIDMCEEVNVYKEGKLMQEIITDLKQCIRENKLDGLSAPQIGYKKRIFVINFGDDDLRTFVNPFLKVSSDIMLYTEDCVSSDKKCRLIRHPKTKVGFQTPTGELKEVDLVGKVAILAQHLNDHLNGIMGEDLGFEIDEDWDKLTEEQQHELEGMYLDSLDLASKQMAKEVEETEMGKKTDDAIKFMEAVSNGEVKISEERVEVTVPTKKDNKSKE